MNIQAPHTWNQPEKHLGEGIKNEWYKLINELFSEIFYSSVDFYREKDFDISLMPITCDSVSSPMGLGSDSLPVKVNLFDRETFLADSMQFQLEYMLRNSRKKGVWYIMPSFRAEEPDETHLNQFFHSEAEIEGELEDVIKLVNEYIHFLSSRIFDKFSDKIDLKHVKDFLDLNHNIPEIDYKEAVEVLKGTENTLSETIPGHYTITRIGERKLMERYNGVVWLKNIDYLTVPFYQAICEDNKQAKCADLLLGIGEIVGCGERNTTVAELKESLKDHQVNEKDYDWYIQMKELCEIRTSGFGLGLERFLLWILNHDDIRDINIMPRLKNIKGGC